MTTALWRQCCHRLAVAGRGQLHPASAWSHKHVHDVSRLGTTPGRAASSEPEQGEYVRPRSPLAQAAWDYQEEAKARLAEDGGITTETAFEILAVRTVFSIAAVTLATVSLQWKCEQRRSHAPLPLWTVESPYSPGHPGRRVR